MQENEDVMSDNYQLCQLEVDVRWDSLRHSRQSPLLTP